MLLAVAPAGAARGAPELAVDVDPAADGVQAARTLGTGEELTVEIPLDADGETLNGFQLELRFDPAVLEATSVESAGFLAAPTRVLQGEVQEGEARIAAVTLGDDGAGGEGVLARVHFEALAPGETALRLGDVRLPRAFGEPVLPGAAEPATVVVVPEPAAGLAGLGALGALVVLGRRAARGGRRGRDRATARWPGRRSVFPGLAVLILVASGGAARAMPDANADGFVDVLDASLVSSCLGVDPASDPTCAPADVDGDGDVDSADLDAVAAAFGDDLGPPYRLPGRLFDCERDGFPCSLADVPLETVRRMDAVLADAATRLEEGDSLEEVEDVIAGLPDADRCFRDGDTVVCRLQGARPMVIHDGAEARDVGGTPVGPFVPSVGEFPAGRGPVGQRVVGRDRDEDGRRDREKRAIVLSPFALDFEDADSAPLARDYLDSSTPYADFPDYDGRIVYKENADVGVADFLELDDFDVVFVSTHGDAITGERNGARVPFEVLFLEAALGTDPDALDATCEAARELTEPPGVETGREIVCGILSVGEEDDRQWVPSIGATPKFFGRLYPQGLRNALIYLDACRSYRTRGLVSALMGTHSVFFGWDDYVPTYLSYNAALGVFDRSARLGMRLSRAWQLTCSEDGSCLEPLDPGDPSSDANDKAAELSFAFDGADQRLREVLTILDPETMQPADGDGEVLVERFAGVLGDGLEGDLLGFFVELEGFEAEDLALRPPEDWLEEMTWFSADRDGVEQQGRMDGGSLQPLGLLTSEQGLLTPVGDPDEYRWRSTQIVGVGLKEDLEPGEELVIDPKLIFPPTEGRPPSFMPEDGYSYARTYEHTVGACSFDAQVGSGGSFSGAWAVVEIDGGDWELEMQDLSDFASAPGARFNAQLDAAAVGSQPGAVQRLTVKVPGGPFSLRSYRWTPSIGADEGLAAPTVQSVADGERVTGSIQGSVVDESVDPPDVESVSISFDADLYLDEPPEFPCVR